MSKFYSAKDNTNEVLNAAAKYTVVILACLVIVFALSVMTGWYAHLNELIRYVPGTIAMVFNTALCFIMLAGAILSIEFKVPYVAKILFAATAIVCTLVAVEEITDIQLGIDQLFFTHYDSVDNNNPGRMAPSTLFCFMIIVISLFLINYKHRSKSALMTGGTLSMLVFTISAVFASGYFSNAHDSYQPGMVTPMASTTAFGFMLLSLTTIAFNFQRSIIENINLIKYTALLMGLSLFIASITLAVEISQQQSINNYYSSLPAIIIFAGLAISILFGLFSYLVQVAVKSAKNYAHALSVMQATLESTADGILVLNMQGKIVVYNKTFAKMWELDENNLSVYDRRLLHGLMLSKVTNQEEYLLKSRYLAENLDEQGNDVISLKNGSVFERNFKPQILNNEVIGRVYSYSDITLQKKLQDELTHQATYDVLTGLPNRALLLDISKRSIEHAKKTSSSVGVFLIDIDKFSNFNDLFGRSKGDVLLKNIAGSLQQNLPEGSILGRIGGDEFLVITQDLNRSESAVSIINTLFAAFSHNMNLYGHDIKVTCCIGVAIYPKDGHDTDELLANADIAMLRAKK